jgi:hypothetical protein
MKAGRQRASGDCTETIEAARGCTLSVWALPGGGEGKTLSVATPWQKIGAHMTICRTKATWASTAIRLVL